MSEIEIRGVITDTICEKCHSLETTTVDARIFKLCGNAPTTGSKRVPIQCEVCKAVTWARVHRMEVTFRSIRNTEAEVGE